MIFFEKNLEKIWYIMPIMLILHCETFKINKMDKETAIKSLDDLILESSYNVSRKHFLMDCVSCLIGITAKYDKCTIIFESKEIIILKK